MSVPGQKTGQGIRAEMARRALRQNPDVPLIELIKLLTDPTAVDRGNRRLLPAKGSIRSNIMNEAIEGCGIDKQNPSNVTQFYLRDEGLLIIDLEDQIGDLEDQ